MVNQNPRFPKTRTGAHGGLRRGPVSVTLGAVLVFSALISAAPATAAVMGDMLYVNVEGDDGGLISGLLGDASSTKPQPTVPGSTTATPTPIPATSSTGAYALPQEGTTSGAPAATSGAAPGPLTQMSGPSGSGSGPAANPAAAQPLEQTGAAGTEPPANAASGKQKVPDPSAPSTASVRASGPAEAGHPADRLQPTGRPVAAEALAGRVPVATEAAVQAPIPATVWWGVGLVAFGVSAAGLFFRLRRI